MKKHKYLIMQAIGFFGLSGIGWIIDMSIFTFLTFLNTNVIIANIISATTAVTFVYIFSTRKIFENKNENLNLKKKYLFYLVYQIVMILFSSFIIQIIAKQLELVTIVYIKKYAKLIGKILFTPFTMIINFIFMKLLIEKL